MTFDWQGDQISWCVELAVKPGELDNFRALTNEMVNSTMEEPGVLIYERFLSEDGKVVHLYERYADSSAAVTHLLAFQKLHGERFMKMVDRKRFTVFGSPSEALRNILNGLGATYATPLAGFSR